MRSALPLLIALLAGPAGAAADAAGEADRVQTEVRAAITALYRGEVDTILRYTYPAIVQALGGAGAARAALAGLARQTDDTVLESIRFPRAPDFVQGAARRYAIVPVHVVLWQHSRRTHSLGFQFGVFDAQASAWTYLEGARLDRRALAELFPDFPSDYPLPPVSREEQE